MFLFVEVYDPVDKYRNVQFLLHLYKLFGMENVLIFLNNFIYDAPELFIKDLLKQYKRRENIDQKQLQRGYPYFSFK